MKTYQFYQKTKQILADLHTPVGLYLKLRDKFPGSFLLESSDYKGKENSISYICLCPLVNISATEKAVIIKETGKEETVFNIEKINQISGYLSAFKNAFTIENEVEKTGIFGFLSYEAVQIFEQIYFEHKNSDYPELPLLHYSFFKYILKFNHYTNELQIIEHSLQPNSDTISELLFYIESKKLSEYPFETTGSEQSFTSDSEYENQVKQGIKHCQLGNVFQIVLSKEYKQKFSGDDFKVYRNLRAVNPSPYLFYFDFGSFRLFGSSPEAQLLVKNGKATINPIAGTFKRSGNDQTDKQLAEKLLADAKENAEHVMLVDLARNDLSKHAQEVEVKRFKEVQFYSHVIHLVSEVCGTVSQQTDVCELLGATFPAGTLSGAPKHKAMQLINEIEGNKRGYYGGAVGFIGFDNSTTHAIVIRTCLSINNSLYYRAGAGVVVHSQPENERQETDHKLGAIRKAIRQFENLNQL